MATVGFGERLSWALELREMTQTDLEAALAPKRRLRGKRRQSINEYINGKRSPSRFWIDTVADVLNVDAEWLAEGVGAPVSGEDVTEAQVEHGLGNAAEQIHAAWLGVLDEYHAPRGAALELALWGSLIYANRGPISYGVPDGGGVWDETRAAREPCPIGPDDVRRLLKALVGIWPRRDLDSPETFHAAWASIVTRAWLTGLSTPTEGGSNG